MTVEDFIGFPRIYQCTMMIRDKKVGNIEKSTSIVCNIDKNTEKAIVIYNVEKKLFPRICFHTFYKDEKRIDSDCYKLEILELEEIT